MCTPWELLGHRGYVICLRLSIYLSRVIKLISDVILINLLHTWTFSYKVETFWLVKIGMCPYSTLLCRWVRKLLFDVVDWVRRIGRLDIIQILFMVFLVELVVLMCVGEHHLAFNGVLHHDWIFGSSLARLSNPFDNLFVYLCVWCHSLVSQLWNCHILGLLVQLGCWDNFLGFHWVWLHAICPILLCWELVASIPRLSILLSRN